MMIILKRIENKLGVRRMSIRFIWPVAGFCVGGDVLGNVLNDLATVSF